ncbi:hypothetical protein ACHAXH_008705 [Discostella pseudostelligera]
MKLLPLPTALLAYISRNNAAGFALSRLTSTQHQTILSSSHSLRRRHSTSSAVECGISDSSDENDGQTSYYEYLLSQFQGDFDNYEQVVQDRRHGLTPGEGGGHEHIHCMIVPCPHYVIPKSHQDQPQWLLAAFYFNANPLQIFRFRLYQTLPPATEELPVRMKLNSLMPRLEQQLRAYSDQPCMWWREVWNLWCKDNNTEIKTSINEGEWNDMRTVGLPSMVLPLDGCDVLWEPDWDPSKHSYLYVNEYANLPDGGDSITTAGVSAQPVPSGKSCHAIMEAGSAGAIVDSISLIPGKRILIKDELSLWNDEFWINDRGYDPDYISADEILGYEDGCTPVNEGMPFVYGNRRGVPYKLKRVSNFRRKQVLALPAFTDLESVFHLEREITDPELQWTLGENYRTQEVLLDKMDLRTCSINEP